jgi:UDP-N-acetylglucosamine 1-carboxyvinyltransferase
MTDGQDRFSYKIRRSVLNGSVVLPGAKNSALRLLAATLLTKSDVLLTNYPDALLDSQVHVEMLRRLGKECDVKDGRITIREPGKVVTTLEWEGRSIRNTLLILGALTARFGYAAVPLPGGCRLGERKYDLHVMLLERLGARVWECEKNSQLCAAVEGRLSGTDIHLPIRSTGATENAIICGSLASGRTVIWNPHIRPEILDLICMLRKMGVNIEVHGQEKICVEGTSNPLCSVVHDVIPDNMEAITWLVAAVMTGGDLTISNFPYEHLEVPLIHLRESGARFYRAAEEALVRGGRCYPIEISTGPFPGINSDMQPLFAAYGAMANGESRIIDLRFPGRYAYAAEFRKLGVDCEIRDNLLIVRGGKALRGANVTAADLRAGVALSLLGLVADGETIVREAWQVERGYSQFVSRMRQLGGDIEYLDDSV